MRPRGFALRGATYRFATEAGDLYVTVNRGADGRPFEVFLRIGKSGSTLGSLAEAIGRLVSLALRSGVDPHEVVRQLKDIKSAPTRQPDGAVVASIPDAVAKAIEDFLSGGSPEAEPVKNQQVKPPDKGSALEGALFLPLG